MVMSTTSTVLQISSKSNMFPDENDGEPKLEILEHPKSRGFRFRYTCEGPSHGGIPGGSSDKNKKTFPAVRICNYQGYARIVVQLVTNEENPRLHPHSLVGKQCQNGICTVQCGPKDMTATFPNLGIQHVTKKNVATILEERYIAAEMQLSSINDGFPQEVQRNIKDEDRKRIAAKAQSEAKSIDLAVVRLMFIAYLPDSNGAFTIMLKPVISEAIFDSKAPNAATLKICRMDCNAGSASGGDEVYLLCDKVQKDDIQVRFVEEDMQGNELWENYGNFCPTDVHRQFAIVFRTPPYKDQAIKSPVNVQVQLRRKSDGEVSEPRPFTYLPNKTDLDMIDRKRRKVMPDFLDHIGNNNMQGFNFGSGGNVVPQMGYKFQGSPNSQGGGGKVKEARPPPVKQENPQKGPVDPSLLFMRSHIKQEPKSPPSQHFSSRNGSYQGSMSPQSSPSSMSEGGSPRAPTPPSEPEFIPGTQIPLPRQVKKHSRIPQIQLNQYQTYQQSYNMQQQQQQQQHVVMQQQQQQQQQQQVVVQQPEMAINPIQNATMSLGYTSPSYPNVQETTMYMDEMPDPDSYIQMLTATSQSSFIENSFDQNQNPLETINSNDIVQQALDDSMNSSPGPGSGSVGLNGTNDPLMTAPLTQLYDLSLLRHPSLHEITIDDLLFDNIESDAGRDDKQPPRRSERNYASALRYEEGSLLDEVDCAPPSSVKTPTFRPAQPGGDVETDNAMIMRMGALTLDGPIKAKQPMKKQPIEMVPLKLETKLTTTTVVENRNETKAKETAAKLDTALETYMKKETKETSLALHDFSVTGDIRMILVLQRHLTNMRDNNGDTVIHVAVIHDQLDVLSSLLDVVATLDNSNAILDSVNTQQQTALHIAALTDNVEAVIDLLKFGANPLVVDAFGNHSIHVASRHGKADILSRLLNAPQIRGRNPDIRNHSGLGCFHLAAKAKKETRQCLKLLMKHEFDVNLEDTKSRRRALHIAVENNNLLVAGSLISECNADIEAATLEGYTPLHVAAANECCEIAMLLLACGADVDASSVPPDSETQGVTPRDLAKSDKIRDILNGKSLFTDDEDDIVHDDSFIDEDDLSCLDPLLRTKLCKLLNQEKSGSDWIALADRLDLSDITSYLKGTNSPTDSLLENYMLRHGSVDGLRSALMNIGRHDAVQLLNRALLSDPHQTIDNLVSDQIDSAIGSLPAPLDVA